MLYGIHDASQFMAAPLRLMAEATQEIFRSPFHPLSYTALGRSIAAGAEVIESVLTQRPKPEWGLDTTTLADGRTVPVTVEIASVKPFCDLLHFKREVGEEVLDEPTLLLVAPLSGHHATLLRGTVQELIKTHEVYVTDWRDARLVPAEAGPFGVDTYIAYLIDFIRQLAGEENNRIHTMAVCQPAPLLLSATALMASWHDPATPKSMTLMGGPIDTRVNPTIVTTAAENRPVEWFKRNCITTVPAYYPGAGREVYPGFLQIRAFMAMNPARHVGAHLKMFDHLVRGDGDSAESHRKFYDEYLAVLDATSEYYLETVDTVFKQHALPRGKMIWNNDGVDPEAITDTALFTVEGELDDISAPGQTYAAHTICDRIPAEKRAHHLQTGVGHYGIFNGRRWREQIAPRIAAFIRANA